MTPKVPHDPLAPARGVLFGMVLSIPLWVGIIWTLLRIARWGR